MKKLEFETSKGGFLIVDDPILPQAMSVTTKYIKLSEITEEQASEIVDYFTEYSKRYQDYERLECAYLTAIESLHSLLKSKGIHLYDNPFNIENCFEPVYYANRLEAEQKTFYNPYIFKL